MRAQRRHYGRRKGPTLSPRQAGLIETLLPQIALGLVPGRDPLDYFDGGIRDVWLEIGFGAGEHLVWQANANPAVGIIGAEPYVAGMAKLLAKIDALAPPAFPDGGVMATKSAGTAAKRPNIRLYMDDATDIVAALPERSLARVFILFPDPWPKTRHHKRRFLQMAILDELARVMKQDAELRFATDDEGYLVWALERLVAHPKFDWMARAPGDWRTRPADWPATRYETKAIREGRRPTYLRFRRQG